jgi:hypothetical protein
MNERAGGGNDDGGDESIEGEEKGSEVGQDGSIPLNETSAGDDNAGG